MVFAVERSGDRRWLFYPVWRVVVSPDVLTFELPTGQGAVSIDGQPVALPTGESSVAVLPLSHLVTFAGTQILAEQKLTIDGFGATSHKVAYSPKLTDAGLAKAKSAIAARFNDICLKQTSAHPTSSGCPQNIATDLLDSGQWQLIGDPTRDLAIRSDGPALIAVGHYQMVFAYTESGIKGINHVAIGGGYTAPLQLSTSDITVDKVSAADGLPALDRPSGATDQAAEDLVAKAFAHCASVPAEFVADCPQRAPDAVITNVRWTLSGDPASGANVTYSGDTGIVTVHGNFAMSVSYKQFGQTRNRSSYITAYEASLFWDGQALQLVSIESA